MPPEWSPSINASTLLATWLTASEPEPPAAPLNFLDAAMAAEAATTVALMVSVATAVALNAPPITRLEFLTYARVCPEVGDAPNAGSQPMKLRANAAPIATPTPAVSRPTPTDSDAPTIIAVMCESLDAVTDTPPVSVPRTRLSWIEALALVRMIFVASAPAPLNATPASLLKPAANEAATAVAVIVASSMTTAENDPLNVIP